MSPPIVRWSSMGRPSIHTHRSTIPITHPAPHSSLSLLVSPWVRGCTADGAMGAAGAAARSTSITTTTSSVELEALVESVELVELVELVESEGLAVSAVSEVSADPAAQVALVAPLNLKPAALEVGAPTGNTVRSTAAARLTPIARPLTSLVAARAETRSQVVRHPLGIEFRSREP